MKNTGFTLAEVLITLGIIGVVAAMTMPSLIQNHKQKEASARLKKFYSIISQAILFSEIENGPSNDWDKTYYIKNDKGEYDNNANKNLSKTFFYKYLAPYIKYVDVQESELDSKAGIKVIFADGSTLFISNGGCIDLNFDVNGERKPNKKGRDIFTFLLCMKDYNDNHCGSKANFCGYSPKHWPTRKKALDACNLEGKFCSQLLMYDNFEFKNDYPHKL